MPIPIPPAPTKRDDGTCSLRAAGPTVASAAIDQPAESARATDADSGSATGSSQQQGGTR